MNTTGHLSQDDLALFALQLLPEDETAAALEHLAYCHACRKEVGEFHGDLVLYSLLAETHTPPALARERLLRRVAQEKRVAPIEKPTLPAASIPFVKHGPAGGRGGVLQMESRSIPARSRFVAAAGWALAACLAIAAGLLFHQRQQLRNELNSERASTASAQENASSARAILSALTDPAALSVTLREPAAHGAETPQVPEAHAAYLPDRGALVFVASNLEPLQPYKVYELWLLPSDAGQPPIPAGSFRPDAAGRATIVLPAGPRLVAVKGFGVTREDANSQPRRPTLPILLMGSSKT